MGVLAVGLALVAGACAPPGDPGPGTPTWRTTRIARTVTPSGPINHVGAWTNESWFATVELTAAGAVLKVHPRVGPNGSVLGTPQEIPLPPGTSGLPGLYGENLIVVSSTTFDGVSSNTSAHFYRETGGPWAAAGSVAVPEHHTLAGATDRWLAARLVPGAPGQTGDGQVAMWSLDTTGPTVVATPVAPLTPDPLWDPDVRNGFGVVAALDGDLAAVTARSATTSSPGVVRVFRASAGTWSAVGNLAGSGTESGFGQSLTVDDGVAADRVAAYDVDVSLLSTTVRVFSDAGSGFTLEQTLAPDPSLPDESNRTFFGGSLDLEGDLLAVLSRTTSVASMEPGHAPVKGGYVTMFRRGATWEVEQEVPMFVTPPDPGVVSAYPFALQIAGDHVAATMLVSPDPPPGCPFPCFYLGFEAWSIDRS